MAEETPPAPSPRHPHCSTFCCDLSSFHFFFKTVITAKTTINDNTPQRRTRGIQRGPAFQKLATTPRRLTPSASSSIGEPVARASSSRSDGLVDDSPVVIGSLLMEIPTCAKEGSSEGGTSDPTKDPSSAKGGSPEVPCSSRNASSSESPISSPSYSTPQSMRTPQPFAPIVSAAGSENYETAFMETYHFYAPSVIDEETSGCLRTTTTDGYYSEFQKSADEAMRMEVMLEVLRFVPLSTLVMKGLCLSKAVTRLCAEHDDVLFRPHWDAVFSHRHQNEQILVENALNRLDNNPSYYHKIRSHFYAFARDPVAADARHSNVFGGDFVFQKGFTGGTFGARGKLGVTRGVHVYAILWRTPYGTCATLGAGLISTVLTSAKYEPLVGRGEASWGFFLSHSKAKPPGGVHCVPVEDGEPWHEHYLILNRERDTIGIIPHGRDTLYEVAMEPGGAAVYPMIGTVYGGNKVYILYLGDRPDIYEKRTATRPIAAPLDSDTTP